MSSNVIDTDSEVDGDNVKKADEDDEHSNNLYDDNGETAGLVNRSN